MSRKPRVPKYRRHPNGQAFVQVDNRRRYLGKWGSPESMTRYRAILIELETKAEVVLWPAATAALTIVELVARYLQFAKSYYVKEGKPTKECSRFGASSRLASRSSRVRGTHNVEDLS